MEGGLQHLRQVTELFLRLSATQVQAAGHAPQRLRQPHLQLRPLAVEGPVLTQLLKVLWGGDDTLLFYLVGTRYLNNALLYIFLYYISMFLYIHSIYIIFCFRFTHTHTHTFLHGQCFYLCPCGAPPFCSLMILWVTLSRAAILQLKSSAYSCMAPNSWGLALTPRTARAAARTVPPTRLRKLGPCFLWAVRSWSGSETT